MDENIADAPVDWNDIDYEGISEFLKKKGAVELLAYLDGHGYRFEEIDDNLNLSRGYINDRRNEALNLDLIYPSQQDRDGTICRVWALSPLGMILAQKMHSTGLRGLQQRLITLRNEYQEMREEFIEWSDNPDEIEEFLEKITEEARTNRKGSTLSFQLKRYLDRYDEFIDDSQDTE